MAKATASQRLYQVKLKGGPSHKEYSTWYQNVRINLNGMIDSFEARPNVYVVASGGPPSFVLTEATSNMKAASVKDVEVQEITKASLKGQHAHWADLVQNGYYKHIKLK